MFSHIKHHYCICRSLTPGQTKDISAFYQKQKTISGKLDKGPSIYDVCTGGIPKKEERNKIS